MTMAGMLQITLLYIQYGDKDKNSSVHCITMMYIKIQRYILNFNGIDSNNMNPSSLSSSVS